MTTQQQDQTETSSTTTTAYTPPTITVGQLKKLLADIPDDIYVLGYVQSEDGTFANYINVMPGDPTSFSAADGDNAVVLNMADDYDTRQW